MDYAALGERLRAYRMGQGWQAEDVAQRLGISRAAVYRLEKGEIVKIDTLERLAQLLDTSMAGLLGVGDTEYYSQAVALLERMRQIEQRSDRILAHFEPVSLLLTSEHYLGHLQQMLLEALPVDAGSAASAQVAAMVQLVAARRASVAQRQPHIVSLMGLQALEQMLRTGLVGRLDLPAAVRAARVQAAREEVLHIAHVMEQQPWFAQIGVVDDAMPSATFEVLYGAQHRVVMQSPFRLGTLPNVQHGIATVMQAPEAVALHEQLLLQLWSRAAKGAEGAARLRALVARAHSEGTL